MNIIKKPFSKRPYLILVFKFYNMDMEYLAKTLKTNIKN